MSSISSTSSTEVYLTVNSLPTWSTRYCDFTVIVNLCKVNLAVLRQAALPTNLSLIYLQPHTLILTLHSDSNMFTSGIVYTLFITNRKHLLVPWPSIHLSTPLLAFLYEHLLIPCQSIHIRLSAPTLGVLVRTLAGTIPIHPCKLVCTSPGVPVWTLVGTMPIHSCKLVCSSPGVPVWTLAGTMPIHICKLVCSSPGVPVWTLAGTMPIHTCKLVCTSPGVPVWTLAGTMPIHTCKLVCTPLAFLYEHVLAPSQSTYVN